ADTGQRKSDRRDNREQCAFGEMSFRADELWRSTARLVLEPRPYGTHFARQIRSRRICHCLARSSQVSTTVSGFSEIDSMPSASSQRARSGWSLGPWPQMPMYFFCLRQAEIAMCMKIFTASL